MRVFGHKRPLRDRDGNIIGQKESPVGAITREELGGAFGADKRRRLIVTLESGDVIGLRPHGTQRKVTLRAADIYRYALMQIANLATLEKARVSKAKKADRLMRARLQAAERRLTALAKKDSPV